MKFDSVIPFLQKLENDGPSSIYRGQANSEWELIPSLARIEPDNLDEIYPEGWKGIEQILLLNFEKHAVIHLEKEPKNKIEWMVQAQHYGVPTRLLDWTTNPLKALYFAVEDTKYLDKDASVFLLTPSRLYQNPDVIDPDTVNQLTTFYPKSINNRVFSQESCFTLFPMQNSKEKFQPLYKGFSPMTDVLMLEKHTIDKGSKERILSELNILGVSDLTMFQDIIGVAKNVRRKFKAL